MIRSSSRSLYKLRTQCRSSSSVPSCRLPITTTAVRRFTTVVAIGNRRETGNFGSLVSLRNVSISEARSFASRASQSTSEKDSEENRKDVTTVEVHAPTDNIPKKPMNFRKGEFSSLVIKVGLAIASAAGCCVLSGIISESKENEVFNKAMHRIQDDSQVKVRIGSPITGHGQKTRNRYARRQIANKVWKDDDGFEHVKVKFYIRGAHGAGGEVFSEMFKDKEDNQWKFIYLEVEIHTPYHSKMVLESHIPA